MSLACLECNRCGSFDTLVVFSEDGKFDLDSPASRYPNYYTCCARLADFEPVEASRFMVVERREHEDSWLTGTDGEAIKEAKHKLVSKEELGRKLPRILAALLRGAGKAEGWKVGSRGAAESGQANPERAARSLGGTGGARYAASSPRQRDP